MTKRKFAALVALVAFAAGLAAAVPFVTYLPALSGRDRTELVWEFDRSAEAARWMREYYTYTDVDAAFYAGCEYQASIDAERLATYRPDVIVRP